MQFGFSTNAFREYQLEDAIGAIADAGYDGVELLLDEPHLYPPDCTDEERERVEDALETHGIAVSNANAFMLTAIEGFHHPSYIEPDEEYRQQRIDYTLAALETASDLGLPYISIEPGGPIPDGKSREWAMDTFVESLEEVIPKAEAVGVDLLVEPEPDLLIETSDEFLALLERVDSERVKCNFDAGHFYCVGEDPAELVEPLWEHTRHYHLEDIPADRTHEHTQLGDGAMDIDAFLGELEDRGYDGFVTVELYPTRRRRSRPRERRWPPSRNAGGRRVAGGVSSDRNENTGLDTEAEAESNADAGSDADTELDTIDGESETEPERSLRTTLGAVGELVRVPNLFTAPPDVILGAALVGVAGSDFLPATVAGLAIGSVCLYAGNDPQRRVRRTDRRAGPTRTSDPLGSRVPTGRVRTWTRVAARRRRDRVHRRRRSRCRSRRTGRHRHHRLRRAPEGIRRRLPSRWVRRAG